MNDDDVLFHDMLKLTLERLTLMFLDIPYLRELALNNNPLQKIEGHAFEMVPQLVALDVSGKFYRKSKCSHLTNIFISMSRMPNQENLCTSLHNIKQLERLYLHNNKIEEVGLQSL